MIKRSIIIAVMLLILYSIFISIFKNKITRTAQNQYASNVIKAEEYLYEDGQTADVLILGSSLASRIVMDSLTHNYFNMALGGMSIYDGFSILKNSTKVPRTVLVEMNVVSRDSNPNLLTDVFQPILYKVREYLPILRKKYQPVSVAKALVRDRSGMKPDQALYKLPESIFKKYIAKALDSLASQPDPTLLHRKFEELRQIINQLRSAGVQVVFFEMPIYSEAENLPTPKAIREAFYKYFPVSHYTYISMPIDSYGTTDGYHLTKDEAIRYTLYLRNKLNQMKIAR